MHRIPQGSTNGMKADHKNSDQKNQPIGERKDPPFNGDLVRKILKPEVHAIARGVRSFDLTLAKSKRILCSQ